MPTFWEKKPPYIEQQGIMNKRGHKRGQGNEKGACFTWSDRFGFKSNLGQELNQTMKWKR